MNKPICALAVLFVFGVASLAARAGEDKDENEVAAALDQLPPAVKKAVLKMTKDARIEAIDRETDGGRSVFYVEVYSKGVELELTFDQSGALVAFAVEDEQGAEPEDNVIPLNKAPVAAREALVVQAGSAKIDEVVVQDHEGVKLYEAAWKSDGVVREAVVTAAGDVVVLEEEIAGDAAPQAVRQTAGKAFPKGTKLRFERRSVILYEVTAEIDGREKQIIVSPTGQRFDDEQE